MAGVAISTAALIIVLSVFNGLEDLLRSLNNSFDPEIKIEAAKSKTFHLTKDLLNTVKTIPGVAVVTEVIEDYSYVRYRDATQIVTIKGVSENFVDQKRIPENNVVEGKLQLNEGKIALAIVGQGISNALGIDIRERAYALQIYYVNSLKNLDPSRLYTHKTILPGAVFSIVQNIDDKYIIVPLDFCRHLFNYGDKRTSLEIKTTEGFDVSQIQKEIKEKLGIKFSVLNQEEQHQDLYRLLKMEKLFTFLSLSLLMAIGSINIFFTLTMLAIDKKKDISILNAIGADQQLIRRIFLAEGALISFIGALVGLIIGGVLCWIQIRYGFISMGMESSILDGYPVKVVPKNFLYTLAVVSIITFLISIRPATLASRHSSIENL